MPWIAYIPYLELGHGIATQNFQLMLGGATARMDTVDRAPKPGHGDYEAFIKRAVIDVDSTGLQPENPATKALPAGAQGRVVELPPDAPDAPDQAGADTSNGPST